MRDVPSPISDAAAKTTSASGSELVDGSGSDVELQPIATIATRGSSRAEMDETLIKTIRYLKQWWCEGTLRLTINYLQTLFDNDKR